MRGGCGILSPLTVLKVEKEIIKSLGEKENPRTFTFSHSRISHVQKHHKFKEQRRNVMQYIILLLKV